MEQCFPNCSLEPIGGSHPVSQLKQDSLNLDCACCSCQTAFHAELSSLGITALNIALRVKAVFLLGLGVFPGRMAVPLCSSSSSSA